MGVFRIFFSDRIGAATSQQSLLDMRVTPEHVTTSRFLPTSQFPAFLITFTLAKRKLVFSVDNVASLFSIVVLFQVSSHFYLE